MVADGGVLAAVWTLLLLLLCARAGALPARECSLLANSAPTGCVFTCCNGEDECFGVKNNPTSCAALGAFYSATQEEGPWLVSYGWANASAGTPTDFCGFFHIICDEAHVEVNQLGVFDANNMVGAFPAAVGSLTSLTFLELSNQKIYGTIPDSVGSLTMLNTFHCLFCSLSGTLPDAMAALTGLVHLDLSYNLELSGTIPGWVGSLTLLEDFGILRAALTGTLPDEMANMRSLSNLYLSGNQLTGSIPSWIGQLTMLQGVILSTNGFTGTIPPEIGQLPELSYLSISYNSFSGVPPPLCPSKLAYIGMDAIPFAGPVPEWLGNCSLVSQLLISHTGLSGTLPASLGSLTLLSELVISSMKLVGSVPSSFARLTNLRTISAKASGLCGPYPWPATAGVNDDGPLPVCPQTVRPSGGTVLTAAAAAAISIASAALCAALLLCARRRLLARRWSSRDSSSVAEELLGESLLVDASVPHLTSVGWKADAADGKLQSCIGKGGFASVYAARWCGATVAVKVFKKWGSVMVRSDSDTLTSGISWLPATLESISSVESISNELAFLSQLRHPNIVLCYAFVSRPAMLVMELAVNGSLHSLLNRTSLERLGWRQRIEICCGVAAGVEFLHKQSPAIIHLDLKCSNVLLDHAYVPKVGDFGLSTLPVAERSRVGGTPRFMAPEVALAQVITNWEAIDSYGFGYIVYDVMHTNTAVQEDSLEYARTQLDCMRPENIIMQRIKERFLVPISEHVPPGMAAIIGSCLEIEPGKRPLLTAIRRSLDALLQEMGDNKDDALYLTDDTDLEYRSMLSVAIAEMA